MSKNDPPNTPPVEPFNASPRERCPPHEFERDVSGYSMGGVCWRCGKFRPPERVPQQATL